MHDSARIGSRARRAEDGGQAALGGRRWLQWLDKSDAEVEGWRVGSSEGRVRNAVVQAERNAGARGAEGDMVGLPERPTTRVAHQRAAAGRVQDDLEHPDGVEAFACPCKAPSVRPV